MAAFNTSIIPVIAAVIELIGIMIIVLSIALTIYDLVIVNHFQLRNTDQNPELNHGLAMALEILLAAEILKTLIARSMSQLLEVGSLIVLRILLTVLIHWELNQKEKSLRLDDKQLEMDIKGGVK